MPLALNYFLIPHHPRPLPMVTKSAIFSANMSGSQELFLRVSLVEVEQTEQVYTGPTAPASGAWGAVVGVDDD